MDAHTPPRLDGKCRRRHGWAAQSRACGCFHEKVTGLLRARGDGDRDALDRLMPIVYAHLRELADTRLLGEPGFVSVNTTALVHEACIRLVGIQAARFRDRAHFLAMASRAMRRVLVDHARARAAAKRGGGAVAVDLHENLRAGNGQPTAVTEPDAALKRLETVDERQARILEQRYFGGLTLEEDTACTLAGVLDGAGKRGHDLAADGRVVIATHGVRDPGGTRFAALLKHVGDACVEFLLLGAHPGLRQVRLQPLAMQAWRQVEDLSYRVGVAVRLVAPAASRARGRLWLSLDARTDGNAGDGSLGRGPGGE